jgi:hypothetical protein
MFNLTWRSVVVTAVVLVAAACAAKKDDGMSRSDQIGIDSSSMGGMSMSASAGVEYTIVLKSLWTRDRFPFEYPEAGTFTGPHFSGLIGAAHSAAYSIFAVGSRPSAGLERLSEEGKHTPLDGEIRLAIDAGTASSLFESGPLRDFNDSLIATVRVDAEHPLVSLVAMVAPSPDWFTGVANVNLMEEGTWTDSRTLELWAYDSGGDNGITYKAADQDNNPKKPTTREASRHFAPKGAPLPVATITISRR